MSVEKYSQFISEQQKSLEVRGLAENVGLQEEAIMKHFHGEDGDHGGDPSQARADHEKITNHLAKTIGTKHPVYKHVVKSLARAQKSHDAADRSYDHPDRYMRHRENAEAHEREAKNTYADHLNSIRKSK